jgi:hypothetical protein
MRCNGNSDSCHILILPFSMSSNITNSGDIHNNRHSTQRRGFLLFINLSVTLHFDDENWTFLDLYFAAKLVFWSKKVADHKITEQKTTPAAGNRTHNSQSPRLTTVHRLRYYATNTVIHQTFVCGPLIQRK